MSDPEYLFKFIIIGDPIDLIAQMVHLEENVSVAYTAPIVEVNTLNLIIDQSAVQITIVSQGLPFNSKREIIEKYYEDIADYYKDAVEYYKKYEAEAQIVGPQGASACIIAFDKSSRTAFNRVEKWYNLWLQEFNRWYKGIMSTDVPVALVGFLTHSEDVTIEQGEKLANKLGISYFEMKPTDKDAVLRLYAELAKRVILRL